MQEWRSAKGVWNLNRIFTSFSLFCFPLPYVKTEGIDCSLMIFTKIAYQIIHLEPDKIDIAFTKQSKNSNKILKNTWSVLSTPLSSRVNG